MTEPDAGTDTSRIITRAAEDGMGGWIVNGRKIWSSKALESEVCLLLARTDGQPGEFNGLRSSSSTSTPSTVTSRRSPRSAATPSPPAKSPTTTSLWRGGAWSAARRSFHHILHGLNPERILLSAMAWA